MFYEIFNKFDIVDIFSEKISESLENKGFAQLFVNI